MCWLSRKAHTHTHSWKYVSRCKEVKKKTRADALHEWIHEHLHDCANNQKVITLWFTCLLVSVLVVIASYCCCHRWQMYIATMGTNRKMCAHSNLGDVISQIYIHIKVEETIACGNSSSTPASTSTERIQHMLTLCWRNICFIYHFDDRHNALSPRQQLKESEIFPMYPSLWLTAFAATSIFLFLSLFHFMLLSLPHRRPFIGHAFI